MESIVNTTKKSLGIDPSDDSFDQDLIPIINTVIFTLFRLELDQSHGFTVTTIDDKWSDYFN